MKKSFKKFLMHTLELGLSIFMLASFSVSAISWESRKKHGSVVASAQSITPINRSVDGMSLLSNTEKRYVKDVKFIVEDNLENARKAVPDGYTLVETDLNQGAEVISDVDNVYLAYLETTNPEEAITDIKMMNMKGGFVFSDYEDQINNVDQKIKNMVVELKEAVKTFVENYKKGTNGAKAAYRTLSAFTVDEYDNGTLANYFINAQVPDGFYLKLLLNAHMDVLSSILSALTIAVQGEAGDTWLDRLSKIENPKEVTNSLYWDQAVDLYPQFESFFLTYDEIDHDALRGPGGPLAPKGSENSSQSSAVTETEFSESFESGEIFYELAHIIMEQYSFGNGTLVSDWLVCDYLYEEMLYPLIEVLTPAEYAMMHLCGPLFMTFATNMDDEVCNDYLKRADEIIEESGTCSVWVGVNQDLLRSSIGITDEACRAIVETEAIQELKDQGDSSMETMLRTAGLFAAIGLVSFGAGLFLVNLFGSSLFTGIIGTSAALFSCKAAVVTSIAGIVCSAAGVAIIVVALVLAVIYLAVWLIDWIASYYPELTEIPEYMYDYVIDDSDTGNFLLYEVARDQNGNPVDVNAFDGKEWHAPYISRDKNAGAPIEADFVVKTGGDGRVEEGYSALSSFGKIYCENMNGYAFDDEVKGIYVSYRQENRFEGPVQGKYLSDLRLFTAETEAECKLKLKNEKFQLYDLNLTPDTKSFTYLGFKTTNKTLHALTDIRFAYNYSATQYNAGVGTLTYAESGTSGDLTLYTTRVGTFGSPIYADFKVVHDRTQAPKGYEPVNMFSGGSAVNIHVSNTDKMKYLNEYTPYYLYFLPSKAYVSGTEYVGGLAMMYDVSWEGEFNGDSSVANAAVEMNYNLLATVQGECSGSDGEKKAEGAILFTKTYNPYRAIYDVSAMTLGGEMGNIFSETIIYGSKGYMIASRYVVDYKNRILYDTETRAKDSKMYVAGASYGGTPLKPSDVTCTSVLPEHTPDGYRAVSAILLDSEKPVNVTSGLTYSYVYGYGAGKKMNMTMQPLYLYVRGKAYQEGKALTSVYIVSKEQLLAGQDIDCDELDKSYVVNAIASKGAHRIFDENLNLEDSDNATYLGYTKDATVRDPITDMILYYAGETDQEPSAKYTKNGIEYHLVSDANIFCEENHENEICKRVYLYTTTNPAAGDPILDIKIDNTAIIDGWQTVRTQNGKALYDDMDDYAGDMWFIHMNRGTETPKYISELVVGWGNDAEAKAMLLAAGCDYMLERDLNDGVGAHSDYVYLGYKRTSDPNKAIRNIISVHDEDYESFTKNGAKYQKVQGNLNSYTNVFADDIYLFYTKDKKAGKPITSLGTSGSVANWKHGKNNRYVVTTVLNQHGKASDLNDGASGYYIYLLQTRDEGEQALAASMIGEGSVLLIITFAAVSACIVEGIYIIRKKRQGKENKDTGTQSNSQE